MRNLTIIVLSAALLSTAALAEIADTGVAPEGKTGIPSVTGNPADPPTRSELPPTPSNPKALNNGPGSAGTAANPGVDTTATVNGEGLDPTKGIYSTGTDEKTNEPVYSGSSSPEPSNPAQEIPTQKEIDIDADGDTGARGSDR